MDILYIKLMHNFAMVAALWKLNTLKCQMLLMEIMTKR